MFVALVLALAGPAEAFPWIARHKVEATFCNRILNALGGGEPARVEYGNTGYPYPEVVDREAVGRGLNRAIFGTAVLIFGGVVGYWAFGGKATPTPTPPPASKKWEPGDFRATVPAPKPVPFTPSFALNPLEGTNEYTSNRGELSLTMLPKLSKDSQNEATRLFATDALSRAGKPEAVTADDVDAKVESFLRDAKYHSALHVSALLDAEQPETTEKVVRALAKALDGKTNASGAAPTLDIYLSGKHGAAVTEAVRKQFRATDGLAPSRAVDPANPAIGYKNRLAIRYVDDDGATIVWRTASPPERK